jgi:tetratricopeptide (TPR) repeat protein
MTFDKDCLKIDSMRAEILAASEKGDWAAQARLLAESGLRLYEKKEYRASAEAFKEEANILRSCDDSARTCNALYNTGRALSASGIVDEAMSAYRECLDSSLQHSLHDIASRAAGSLAAILARSGELSEAKMLYSLAMEKLPETQRGTKTHAELLCGFGHSLLVLGETRDADLALESAYGILDRIGEDWLKATTSLHLATLHQSIGDVDGAIGWLQKSHAAFTRNGSDRFANSIREKIENLKAS